MSDQEVKTMLDQLYVIAYIALDTAVEDKDRLHAEMREATS